MRKYIISLLAMVSSTCFAQSATLDLITGIGIGKNVFNDTAFERYGMLGIQYGNEWKVRLNTGYYLVPGQTNSFVGSVQGGLEVVGRSGAYAHFFFGPALVTTPDNVYLSGNFQFNLTGGIGVRNRDGYGLGVDWNHWSNAGIVQPNLGRDILTLEVTIPLYKP